MEAVFGALSLGTCIQDQNSTLPFNEENHVRDTDIPSTYETHLFPGGVSSSTQSMQTLVGNSSFLHPLLRSLTLPPATSVTSIVSTLSSQREGRNSTQDRSNLRLTAGSYTVDANGSIVRDHNRPEIHDAARVIPSVLTGSWEESFDDFSTSFGQALSTFLQDQTNLQNSTSTNISEPTGQPESSIRSREVEEDVIVDGIEGVGLSADEPMMDVGARNRPPLAPETQTETAEVSCAMASGLTISQPALDDSSYLANNPSDRDFDQTLPSPDEANTRITAAREAEGQAMERFQDEEALPEANPRDDVNETPEVQENDETPEEEGFTCPPDIDPDVFRSLPPEMQQEIIHQHEVAAQISESGLDPEALAALPEDLRREVIEEEQNQQRLREESASQAVADPANVEEMDNAR